MCLYLFTSITLSEIIFVKCYFVKTKHSNYQKFRGSCNNAIIALLNKLIICLIIFNSIIIKYNILSPVELKIFADKNIKIIKHIYFSLFSYIVVFIIIKTFSFC